MNISKCMSCVHFDDFFHSCNLYYREVYLSEGDFDLQAVDIRRIEDEECEYKPR